MLKLPREYYIFIHVRELIRDLSIDDTMTQSIDRANKHLCNDDHDERDRHSGAEADESLGQSFEKDDVFEDAQGTRAHRARGENSCLPGIHDAVGDVEHNHQPSGKSSNLYFGEIAETKQKKEQRKHRRRGRRSEEIDDEFDRSIDALVSA